MLTQIFITLYDAQFEMPKRDRPIIVNRALGHCEMKRHILLYRIARTIK